MLRKQLNDKGSIAALFPEYSRKLLLQWLATVYVSIISIFVSIALARWLGVSEFGTYSYVLSVVSICMIFQNGGYKTILFRDSIEGLNKEIMALSLGNVLVASCLGLLLIWVFRPYEWKTLMIAVICMGLVIVTEFVSSQLKGMGNFGLDALWKVLIRTISGIAIFSLIFFIQHKVIAYIFTAWSLALGLLLIWPISKSWLHYPSFKFRRDLVKSSAALLTIDAATVIYFKSDVILLKYLGDNPDDVGHYAASHRIIEGIILLMTPVAQLGFRALRIRRLQRDRFLKIFRTLLVAMILFGVVLLMVGAVFSQSFVVLIYGPAYQASGIILFWLLISMLFVLPNYILTQSAVALDNEKSYAAIAVIAAFINIILNCYWIPRYGAIGAAWATIVAEGCLCFGLGYIFWITWAHKKGA